MRNSGSETESVPTKSSQSPLRIRSVQVEGVKELGRQLLAPLPREIYPTKISWNLENQNSNKKPSSQIKTSSSGVPKHQNQPDPSFQKTNLSVGASTSSLSLRSLHLMSTLYQRCLACICRRSRCRASALTGTREAWRVVSVGQNWRLDCFFFLARCCLGQVPGGAPFSQRSEQATACTNRMQIRN